MLRKAANWFKALSKVGKIGVIAALGMVGVAAASGKPATPNPPPPPCTASTSNETIKETIPFSKSQVDDPMLDKGQTKIQIAGIDGEKTITYTVTTFTPSNCKPTTKVKTDEEVTKQPVSEVTANGTREPQISTTPFTPQTDCNPNYSPCVPNASYDLDCGDIGFTVKVIGSDPYRLDKDGDGYGCE